jgi:hypothetical protein
MTLIPDEAVESAARRVSLSTGLRDLAAWLDTHPGSPVPDVYASFRVPGGERGEQVAMLNEIAGWLGVPVTADSAGNLAAGRDFGPVLAEARVRRSRPVAARVIAPAGRGAAA